MKIEIYGHYEFIQPDQIQKIVDEFEAVFPNASAARVLEIEFVSKGKIREINKLYRNIDKPTDVLSFPQTEIPGGSQIFGTIVICEEVADNRKEDVLELIKHGLLHLQGFDHEKDNDLWLEAAQKINHKMGLT